MLNKSRHGVMVMNPEAPIDLPFLIRAAERERPTLFKLFYPRVYRDIGPYWSPKVLALSLSAALVGVAQHGYGDSPTAFRLMLPGLRSVIDQKMPLMFLGRDFLSAVQLTDFKEDIDWVNLPLPYESGFFVLPRGQLRHPTDGDVGFIYYSRLRPGFYRAPLSGVPTMPTIELVRTSFAIVACCPETMVWYDANLTIDYRPTLRLNNMFCVAPGEDGPIFELNSPVDEHLDERDKPFLEQLGVVTFGTLMALQARPELLEVARKVDVKPPRKGKSEVVFWTPNIIGRSYRLKREALGGTHATPRMHWRRGHHRSQVCGVNRSGRKLIWIEPVLVGATSEVKA